MARAEGKEEDQDGDKVPESLPTKTPRARYIEHTAAKWAEDATPRGQDAKAYLVRQVVPTLLPALVALMKKAETDPEQLPPVDISEPFDTQSQSHILYMSKRVVPVLNTSLHAVFERQPRDPIDELSKLLFEHSEDMGTPEDMYDEDEAFNPVRWLAQFLFRHNPRFQRRGCVSYATSSARVSASSSIFTPRTYQKPRPTKTRNPRLATPRRRLSPRTFPQETEPKYPLVPFTPREATCADMTLQPQEEAKEGGEKDPPSSAETLSRPHAVPSARGNRSVMAVDGDLELLGEVTRELEVMMVIKAWRLRARRDARTKSIYFTADEVTEGAGTGPRRPQSIVRVVNEAQLNNMLLAPDRWKVTIGGMAAELLKRLVLLPRGRTTGGGLGMRCSLAIAFSGTPEVSKMECQLLRCSRRVQGTIYVVEVCAEKHDGMRDLLSRDELVAGGRGKKKASSGGGGRRQRSGSKEGGGGNADRKAAMNLTGEVAVVLRAKLYDPQQCLYLEAAAPLRLSAALATRRQQVDVALQRLSVVATREGPAAMFRLTANIARSSAYGNKGREQPSGHAPHCLGLPYELPVLLANDDDVSGAQMGQDRGKVWADTVVGITSSDSGPASTGRPLLLVHASVLREGNESGALGHGSHVESAAMLLSIDETLLVPPVGHESPDGQLAFAAPSKDLDNNTDITGSKEPKVAVLASTPPTEALVDIKCCAGVEAMLRGLRLRVGNGVTASSHVVLEHRSVSHQEGVSISHLSRRVREARALDAAVSAVFQGSSTAGSSSSASALDPTPHADRTVQGAREAQRRDQLWALERDQRLNQRRTRLQQPDSKAGIEDANEARAEKRKSNRRSRTRDTSDDMDWEDVAAAPKSHGTDRSGAHGDHKGEKEEGCGPPISAVELRRNVRAPLTGAPQWRAGDGELAFRSVKFIGGVRMIISLFVLKHAVNGSLRIEAHDPDTCQTFSTAIDHYDTSLLLPVPAAGSQSFGGGPSGGSRVSPEVAACAKRICDRVKVEQADWGRGALSIFLWEDSDVHTKMRKAFLGLDRDSHGCVKADDVVQMVALTRRTMETMFDKAARDEQAHVEGLSEVRTLVHKHLTLVLQAVQRGGASALSFEDMLDVLEHAGSAKRAQPIPGSGTGTLSQDPAFKFTSVDRTVHEGKVSE